MLEGSEGRMTNRREDMKGREMDWGRREGRERDRREER